MKKRKRRRWSKRESVLLSEPIDEEDPYPWYEQMADSELDEEEIDGPEFVLVFGVRSGMSLLSAAMVLALVAKESKTCGSE